MAGNTLGPRGDYVYEDDLGVEYKITTDVDLATAAGLVAATNQPRIPSRFYPRGVYVQSATGQRKFLVIGDVTNALYASNGRQNVTIDTVVFTTTGRKGERASF